MAGGMAAVGIALRAISTIAPSPAEAEEFKGGPVAYFPWVSVYRMPAKPVLKPIDNADGDNRYTVEWHPASGAERYVLQEAEEPLFRSARQVYLGLGTRWTTPTGKDLGRHFYRVKARNRAGDSAWSASTEESITKPLQVKDKVLTFAGRTEVRGAERFDYDWGVTRKIEDVKAPTATVKINVTFTPGNPLNLTDGVWREIRDIESSGWLRNDNNSVRDPAVKWAYDWIIHPKSKFRVGDVVRIDNQPFLVWQRAIAADGVCYWYFTNTTKFLAWQENDLEPLWKAYVEPGAAILWYDDTDNHFLYREDVAYTYYYDDKPSGNTEHAIGSIIPIGEELNPTYPKAAKDRCAASPPLARLTDGLQSWQEAHPVAGRMTGSGSPWPVPLLGQRRLPRAAIGSR